MNGVYLSEGEQAALEYLATRGPVFGMDVDKDIYFDFVRLKDVGFAVCELPNPNFLYQLPPEKQEAYQFKITSAGYNEYIRLKQASDESAQREADRAADRAYADQNAQKQFRHDWRIAIFETVTGFILGAIFDHFFDIVGNAVRLWLALKHIFFN